MILVMHDMDNEEFGRHDQGKNDQGTNGHHFNTFNIPVMIRSIEKMAKYSVAIFSLAIVTYNRPKGVDSICGTRGRWMGKNPHNSHNPYICHSIKSHHSVSG